MPSSKIERAQHGPGWAEVLFGAALSVILGAALAAACLVLKPVKVVQAPPKEVEKDMVYFVEGQRDLEVGKTWMRKRQAFLEGQSIDLSEEELNTAAVTPTERPKGAGPSADESAGGAMLKPGVINFRVADGRFQIGLPIMVGFLERRIYVQASGGFARHGEHFRFEPDEIYVGSCPLGRLPFIGGLILKRLYSTQSIPEDLVNAWGRLANVSVQGRVLRLDPGS